MSREAMQMALDMLNEIADDVYCDQKLEGVIAVLRQALVDADDMSRKRVDEMVKTEHEWVGLTDEEIDILSCETVKGNKSVNWLCKVLEAKLCVAQ